MSIPLTAAALAVVSLSAHGAIADGRVLTVHGRHFMPNEQVVLSECSLRRGRCRLSPTCAPRCVGANAEAVAVRDSGAFVARYAPARFIRVGAKRVDCAVADCAITTENALGPPEAAPVRVRFKRGRSRAPLELRRLSVSTARVDPRTGAALLSGSLHCNRRALFNVSAEVNQERGAALPLHGSGHSATVACRPGTNRLRVRAYAAGGSFVAGRVSISAQASGLPESPSSVVRTTKRMRLKQTATATPVYYVALGDSLAAGFNSSPGASYVQDIFRARAPRTPGLTLVDFGCSGETSGSLIMGAASTTGGTCSYPGGGSQLDAAERFLRTHAGHIALVTIDIGGNDFVACGGGPAPDPVCQMNAFTAVRSNLAQIGQRLRTAVGPTVPIASMTYFDPYLALWFNGAQGQDRARQSVPVDDQLSAVIRDAYAQIGAPVADVEGAFATDRFDIAPNSLWGQIPVNVDRVCRWLGSCPQPGWPLPGGFSDDTNDAGSRVIASAFAQSLP